MTTESIITILGASGGILATWVKMTNDVTKVKARLYALEKQETKAQMTLDTLVEMINEIKLLLAKKGIR
jgi:septation ring formation regulator EzrA